MALRDRFFTPTTARAILSWRILVGAGVGVVLAVAGVATLVAIAIGVAVYLALILTSMPKRPSKVAIDAFRVGEPWRQIVQGAQSAGRKLRTTLAGVPAGPLRDRLEAIAAQIEHGIVEVWEVAQRGDAIGDTLRTLDPTSLRSKLATLEQRAAAAPSPDAEAAVESVRTQLATADRLKARSAETATSLRLTQTRLDELVARAGEVAIGAADTDVYAREVDDIVLQLEALRLAIEETRSA